MDKLDIRHEMRQLDNKNRGFYQSLTDEERRKFSTFLMIRWSSAVSGPRDLQEYYVQACNHFLNRHFFAINRHPQLQWLCATAVSPGTGAHDHPWIKPPQRGGSKNKRRRLLMDLFPNMKQADIDTLYHLVDDKELQKYLRDQGQGTQS